jgi:hypothetical protein
MIRPAAGSTSTFYTKVWHRGVMRKTGLADLQPGNGHSSSMHAKQTATRPELFCQKLICLAKPACKPTYCRNTTCITLCTATRADQLGQVILRNQRWLGSSEACLRTGFPQLGHPLEQLAGAVDVDQALGIRQIMMSVGVSPRRSNHVRPRTRDVGPRQRCSSACSHLA